MDLAAGGVFLETRRVDFPWTGLPQVCIDRVIHLGLHGHGLASGIDAYAGKSGGRHVRMLMLVVVSMVVVVGT
jgi:hypothetical protein